MSKIIGMSRSINLEFLNETASLVLLGKTEAEIKEILNEYISFSITSPTNLRKTREILMNIWARTSEKHVEIRDLALKVFNTNKSSNKLVAHWCMILISYSVFGDICSVIGNMGDKQFDITIAQVKNRMFDVWGERTSLFHSIDKNIKTLKDLGSISTIKAGVYEINKIVIKDEKAILLIIATLLTIKDKLYLKIEELENSYEFFPFNYDVSLEELQRSELFSFDKFGGDLVISYKN